MRKAKSKPIQPIGTRALDWVVSNQLINDFTLAVDGGACFGEWTLPLSDMFDEVYAFEPAQESRAIWFDNLKGKQNAVMFPYALMHCEFKAESFKPARRISLPSRQVRADARGRVLAIPLDKMRLRGLTLLKMDLEGCEIPAIIGATDTIAICKPVLIVEFNSKLERHGTLDDLHQLITGMSYELVHTEKLISKPKNDAADRVYIPR